MRFQILSIALLLGGCASLPADRGAAAIDQHLAQRGAPAAQLATSRETSREPASPLGATPLTLPRAVELAFTRSPRMREQFAELGLSGAELLDAGKLPAISLEYSRLRPGHGGAPQVTRGISLAFADLLLLRSRTRIASDNLAGTRERIAARLLDLQTEVESAWYDYVAAQQVSRVQATQARVARAAAEYARRLHAAGNLPPRALARELADVAGAEIAAARAEVQAIEARAALANLAGISSRDSWQVPATLPALPHHDELPAGLMDHGLEARLDISAAARDVQSLERALRAARAWRWLGEFSVGYESETETDGGRLRGPTLEVSLPLLSWNRGGVLRARAAHEAAQAHLDALRLEARNALESGLDRLATSRRIAETYRAVLVPQREAVHARTLEEVNYMLAGAFELLSARREQFAAYQEYVEAVRDYWLARARLRQASGGLLPPAPEGPSLDDVTADTTPASPSPGDAAHDHGAHR